jgi:hypothetical protein
MCIEKALKIGFSTKTVISSQGTVKQFLAQKSIIEMEHLLY